MLVRGFPNGCGNNNNNNNNGGGWWEKTVQMMMKENASAVVAGRQGNFVPWTMLLFQILYILNSKETTKWWELTTIRSFLPFFCLSFESFFFFGHTLQTKKPLIHEGPQRERFR